LKIEQAWKDKLRRKEAENGGPLISNQQSSINNSPDVDPCGQPTADSSVEIRAAHIEPALRALQLAAALAQLHRAIRTILPRILCRLRFLCSRPMSVLIQQCRRRSLLVHVWKIGLAGSTRRLYAPGSAQASDVADSR
jgi:hypothetical protein